MTTMEETMKAVLAAIGGFVAAATLLGSGALLAVFLMITPEAGGGPDRGSATAGNAAVDAQPLERIEPRPLTESQQALARSAVANRPDGDSGGDDSGDGIDMMDTAAIDRSDGPANAGIADDGLANPEQAEALAAHLDWCSQRYRSYRPRDNSYTPYSGGRAVCVSPYSEGFEEGGVSAPPAPSDSYAEGEAVLQPAFAEAAGGYPVYDDAHIAYCLSRYRSYDPADNSYQPYGGGPRQQCMPY